MEAPTNEAEDERQRLGGLVARSEAGRLAGQAAASSLAGLRAGDYYSGAVRVLRTWPAKEFEHQGRPGKVARAVVSDGSRSLALVAWHAQADIVAGLERGDSLKIEGGYAKARDEVLELHANEKARLSKLAPGEGPGEEAFSQAYPARKLSELREGEEALVKARIAEVYSAKTFAKCAGCGQRASLPAEKCTACGSASIRRIDVLAARLDDGSAGYRLACFGSEARKVAGAKGDEALDGLEAAAKERLNGKELSAVVRPKASAFGGGFELSCVILVAVR